jgi:tetratricopeptide (TPR) repeat protein
MNAKSIAVAILLLVPGVSLADGSQWKQRFDDAVAARVQLDLPRSASIFDGLAGDLEAALKAEAAKDRASASTATAQYWLASVYLYQGRAADAKPLLAASYQTREKLFGAQSLPVAQVIEKTVWVASDEDGDRMLGSVLRIREKVLGPEHRDVAATHRDIALRHLTSAEYDEAEEHYDRAIAILEKAAGKDALDTADALRELGWLNVVRRRYADAIPLYRRALASVEKAVPAGDPRRATALEDLGFAYYGAKRYREAEEAYLPALAIRDNVNGPSSMLTLGTAGKLLDVYMASSRPLEERAMRKRLEVLQR